RLYVGYQRRLLIHALHAMTIQIGERAVSGWQYEVARRAWADEVRRRRDAVAAARKERKEKLLRQRRDEIVQNAKAVPKNGQSVKSRKELVEDANALLRIFPMKRTVSGFGRSSPTRPVGSPVQRPSWVPRYPSITRAERRRFFENVVSVRNKS